METCAISPRHFSISYTFMKIYYLIILLSFISFSTYAQNANWQHLDLKKDSVFGISTNQAYDFLKNKKSKTVIVAVIDGGVDTSHADLKSVLWLNPGERRNNHKDDDQNHYVDDIYGWSFLGSPKGNVNFENKELTRLVRSGKARFGDLKALPSDTTGLSAYKKIALAYNRELAQAQRRYNIVLGFKLIADTILSRIGKTEPSVADIKAYQPQTIAETNVKISLLTNLKEFGSVRKYLDKVWISQVNNLKTQLDYGLNLDYDPRSLVGDHINDPLERYYGSPDVTGPDPDHGTHVAGIIGAERNNGFGIQGVADNVRLMVLRAVPNGDERDKDIANAIRYAVDNGARVINMSFGKDFSPDKSIVDEAVKYAMKKDVLIIHAAGNDALDVDQHRHFPERKYLDKSGEAEAWIEVAASGFKNDASLVAGFSNYGQKSIDVFAPGVNIYSTVPGSLYDFHDGTSMAAPLVSGLAALIREYYPLLTANQVKEIILKSVTKVIQPVRIKGKTVLLSDLCITGGVINAYNAVVLADHYIPTK
jgi:cell wall-associated protease